MLRHYHLLKSTLRLLLPLARATDLGKRMDTVPVIEAHWDIQIRGPL